MTKEMPDGVDVFEDVHILRMLNAKFPMTNQIQNKNFKNIISAI